MILLFSLLLLIADFISFFIYNAEAVENNLTNRQKTTAQKEKLFKTLFVYRRMEPLWQSVLDLSSGKCFGCACRYHHFLDYFVLPQCMA